MHNGSTASADKSCAIVKAKELAQAHMLIIGTDVVSTARLLIATSTLCIACKLSLIPTSHLPLNSK